jgi:putative ABC transport system permease protein
VDRAEPILDVACTFEHGRYRRRGTVTGLQSGARLTIPRDIDGTAIRIPRVGLAMSRKLAELLALKLGDTVRVTPVKGRRERLEMPVAEISDSYIGMAVYADIDYLSRLVGESFAMTGAQLSVGARGNARQGLYRELKRLPALQAVNSRADMIENLQLIVETQRIFIAMIVMFAGVIFFSSLLNASLINLAERRREVATLRVLGYTPWQIGGLFFRESLVVNTLGTLLGLPIGYSLAATLARIYDTDMFRFPLVVPPSVWVYTISLAAIFAGAAHLVVQRSVNSLDWLEASKTME